MLQRIRFLGFAVLLGALTTPSARASDAEEAQKILSYFKATCPSSGEWTRQAVDQAVNLAQILESLKSDPACTSISGAIGQMNLIGQRLNEISEDPDEREILALQARERALLQQLHSSSPLVSTDILNRDLLDTQLALANYEGYSASSARVHRRVARGHALENVVSATNTFLQQAVANRSCMLRSPNMMTGLASLAGSVASAASSAGLSMGLAAGVELLGSFVEFFRQMGLETKIGQVSEAIVAQAHQCALESMANQWCAADDALHVVTLKEASLEAPPPNDTLFRGIRYLQTSVPETLDWLEGVEAGVDARSEAAGNRIEKAEERKTRVITSKQVGLGIITDAEPSFNQIPSSDLAAQWSEIKTLVSNLMGRLTLGPTRCSDCTPNPMNELYTVSFVPYYLVGFASAADAPTYGSSNSSLKSWGDFDPMTDHIPAGIRPDPEVIRARLIDLHDRALEKVERELALVLHPDPLLLLTKAATEVRGRSPLKAIRELKGFLHDELVGGRLSPADQIIYDDSVTRLTNIEASIQAGVEQSVRKCPPPPPPGVVQPPCKEATDFLNEIYGEAELTNGSRFLAGRLKWALRLNLTALAETQPPGVDRDTASQLLVADDIVAALQHGDGFGSLPQFEDELNQAMSATHSTVSGYTGVFENSIKATLVHYQELATHEPANGPSTKSMGRLCFKLLAGPGWPKNIPKNLCRGFQLRSSYANGPVSGVLNDQLMDGLVSTERTCAYRNYLRAAKIYEDSIKGRDPQPATSRADTDDNETSFEAIRVDTE